MKNRTCSVDACDKPYYSCGMCVTHRRVVTRQLDHARRRAEKDSVKAEQRRYNPAVTTWANAAGGLGG